MSGNRPSISVVLPVYNAELFVAEAIHSILCQTEQDFELLIFDDGSKDKSFQIIEELSRSDSRIQCFRGPNQGLLRVLQQGVQHARGEYVARMDADDICLASRFERQVKFMAERPECVAVGTRVIWIDPDGDALGPAPVSMRHEDIDKELLYNRPGKICHPTVMMRTAAVRQVGGYQQEYHYEDVDLFLRLAEVGELANLETPLLKYRLHPSSICHTRDAEKTQEIYRSVVASALARRGQAVESSSIIAHNSPQVRCHPSRTAESERAEVHRHWSSLAFENGYFRAAWKHALQALKLSPGSPRCWWTASRCVLGTRMTVVLFSVASVPGRVFGCLRKVAPQ